MLHRAATLMAIIQAHLQPGTTIHLDQWAAYQQVQSLPNVAMHDTVNHSVEFVNSTTGTHTQNVSPIGTRLKGTSRQ